MPASFPSSVKFWNDKQDLIDDVFAGDINGAYHEIIAIENELMQIGYKRSVRVATTQNGDLATAFANGQTVDGVVLATGDRILIKDQTNGAENGIYIVNASGAPTRATDANSSAHMVPGMMVYVREGTVNGKGTWKLTTTGTVTLGTTPLTFENELASHLADMAKVFINAIAPPAPLTAALGDGETDDSAAIQACINYANAKGGGIVVLPDALTFKLIASGIELKSNVKIIMGKGTVLDMSEVTPSGGYKYGIYAKGTVGDSILLTTDATKGTYSFDVADTSGLSVGDWVQVATQGINYYPYGGYNVDRGEIKKIRLISGSTITFETALYDDYAVGNGAFIKKVSFVENIGVVGGKIIGDTNPDSGENGIYFEYVKDFSINDVQLENHDVYQIGLISCIKGNVYKNRHRMSFYDGVTGTIFYGIAVLDCCQDINIFGNHGERLRHLVVTSAHSTGQGYWGQPREIDVHDNFMINAMAGANGRSYAYNHHGFGENIKFHHNTADSCFAGFCIEGGGVSVEDNTIVNWYGSAIMNITAGINFKNISIKNNKIGHYTTEGGGSATPIPIRFDFALDDVIENLEIEDNTIEHDLVKSNAIYLNSATANAAINSAVKNNKIKNINENIGTQYAIYINNVDGLKVKDNYIYDTKNGIYGNAKELVIDGTEFDVESDRILDVGYAIYSGGNDNWITNNKIRRSCIGIRINTGITGNVVFNNLIKADNTTISDSGTSTVKQNNIETVY